MKVTIDRIENDYAVVILEDETNANLPLTLLPKGAGEGSIIKIICCDEDTQFQRQSIEQKMNKLFGR